MAPSVFDSGCTGDQTGTRTSIEPEARVAGKEQHAGVQHDQPEGDVARPVVEREQLDALVRPLTRRVVAAGHQQAEQQVGAQDADSDEGDGSGEVNRGHEWILRRLRRSCLRASADATMSVNDLALDAVVVAWLVFAVRKRAVAVPSRRRAPAAERVRCRLRPLGRTRARADSAAREIAGVPE